MKNFKVIIVVVIFTGIIIFGFYSFLNESTSGVTPSQENINDFNKIVNNVTSIKDINKCEDIGNDELEGLCKSQLENRFSPLYGADNISICLSDKEELKQDMCILEVAYSQSKNKNDTGLCNEIGNQDIKDACFAQVINKKF